MCAIAPNQVASANLKIFVGVEIRRGCLHTAVVLCEIDHGRAAEDAQCRHCRRVSEQHWFQIDLIDPMRWLRRWPPSVGPTFRRVAFSATGNGNARELVTCGG